MINRELLTGFDTLTIKLTGIPVDLPYLDLRRGNGPTFLLTAGMDGDEYDGIVAATYLASEWADDKSWSGRRIIFPIVNLPGYLAGVHWNPYDKKLPTRIFPGNKNGTASEQLLSEVLTTAGKSIDVWIDLHGGNTTEYLQPFVWSFSKKIKNNISEAKNASFWYCTISNCDNTVEKANEVFLQGTELIVLEAGQRGMLHLDAQKRHVQWVQQLITQWHNPVYTSYEYYRSMKYLIAQQSGYWASSLPSQGKIGQIYQEHSVVPYMFSLPHDAFLLWQRGDSWVLRGDILAAYAHNKLMHEK